jgi:hypothetical protein
MDANEDHAECLAREIKEEIGVDITNCDTLLYHTERHDGFVVNFHIVYFDKRPEINIPDNERLKVQDPTWFVISELPYSEFSPQMSEAITAALPYQRSLVAPSGAWAIDDKWIQRSVRDAPPGFDLDVINNIDYMCVAHALNEQLPPEDKIDISLKARTLPPGGYDALQLLPPNKYSLGVWDWQRGVWSYGGPDADICLMYTLNGDTGHLDGLRRSEDPLRRVERVIYTQGLGALRTTTRGSDPSKEKPQPTADVSALPGSPPLAPVIEEKTNQTPETTEAAPQPPPPPAYQTSVLTSTAHEVKEYAGRQRPFVTAPKLWASPTLPGQSALNVMAPDTPPVDGNTMQLSSEFGTATIAMDQTRTIIEIADTSTIRTEVEHDDMIPFGSPSEGIKSVVAALSLDTVDADVHLTLSARCGFATVTIPVTGKNTSMPSTIHLDLGAGPVPPTFVPGRMLQPVDMTDKAYDFGREIGTQFPQFAHTEDRAGVGELLGCVNDARGSSMVTIYELLFCGLFACQTGAGASPNPAPILPLPPAPAPDQVFDFLFPQPETLQVMFNPSAQGRNAPGAGAPRYAVANVPPYFPGGDVANYSIFALRQRKPPVTPAINAADDWRLPLARLHEPYLGLVTNHNYCPRPPAVGGGPQPLRPLDPTLRNAFLAGLEYERPRLVLLTPRTFGFENIAANPAAHGSTLSWRSAISAMLQLFGGSSDCIMGYTRAIQHKMRFISPTITHIPTAINDRFDNGELLFSALLARLTLMRIARPIYDAATPAAVRQTTSWVALLNTINAYPTAGTDLFLPAAGAAWPAAALAIVVNVFPATLQANYATLAPVVLHANQDYVMDAMYYQKYATCPIDAGDNLELRARLRGETTAELSSMAAWLATMHFEDGWGPGAAVVAARPFHETPTWNDGTAIVAPMSYAESYALGNRIKRRHTLPLFNVAETKEVQFPAGLQRLRNAKMGIENYHDDKVALDLAARFTRLTPERIFKIACLIAIQQRAAVDVVSEAMGLNAGAFARIRGTPVFGNAALDRVIQTSSHKYFVSQRLDDILQRFVVSVNEIIQRAGYASTFGTEFALGLSQVEFYPTDAFDYDDHPVPGDSGLDWPLLKWIVLHPLQIQVLLPGAPTAPAMIAKEMRLFGAITPGLEFPWRDWHAGGHHIRDEDTFSAYAIQMGISGYKIAPRMRITARPHTGAIMPVSYEVLSQFRSCPTRRTDCLPNAPGASQHFVHWYTTPLPYFPDPYDDQGRIDFLHRGPIHAFTHLERISGAAPLNHLLGINLRKRDANLNPVGILPAYRHQGYAAGAVPHRTDHLILPGMTAQTGLVAYTQRPGGVNDNYRRTRTWHGLQLSSNTERMRSRTAFFAANGTLAGIANLGNFTDHLGNAPPAGFLVAGANRGMSMRPRDWVISQAPMPEDWLHNGNMQDHYSIYSRVCDRASNWHYQPQVQRIPIVMSGNQYPHRAVEPADYDPTSTQLAIGSSLAFGRFIQFVQGMNPTATPLPMIPGLAPDDTKYLTYDQPTLVQGERHDARHFVNAMSAQRMTDSPPLDAKRTLNALLALIDANIPNQHTTGGVGYITTPVSRPMTTASLPAYKTLLQSRELRPEAFFRFRPAS